MADSATEIDLDSVIDRLLEGELAILISFFGPRNFLSNFWYTLDQFLCFHGWKDWWDEQLHRGNCIEMTNPLLLAQLR